MKKNTIGSIILIIILIGLSQVLNQQMKSSAVIKESVSFGEFSSNRALPFTIKENKTLSLTVNTKVKYGEINVCIVSPNGNVIYEKQGNNLNEKVKLDLRETGIWKCIIKTKSEASDVAKNGSYDVTGELE